MVRGDIDPEHHQRDDDGEDAVAERFEAIDAQRRLGGRRLARLDPESGRLLCPRFYVDRSRISNRASDAL